MAAGVDIGSRFHVVSVPQNLTEESVRTFSSFTGDLVEMAKWFKSLGIKTIAMESTGVYWCPCFEILRCSGFEVILVNGRAVKNVPGRKSDVNDAQWLMQLHQFGLLRGSVQPEESLASLRAVLRHRERLVEYRAAHIQHIQKSLTLLNIQLNTVVSDITGVTAFKIIRSILDGERDTRALARFRDARCKKPFEVIEKSLHGNWREEHLFTLQDAMDLYEFYSKKIEQCDSKVESLVKNLKEQQFSGQKSQTPPKKKHRTKQRNEPNFDVHGELFRVLGFDMTQVFGFGPYTVLRLVAECGFDLSKWPTSKHFTSWLTLCPGTNISGGRILSSASRKSTNRATTLFRICAVNVGKTKTALGAFYSGPQI